MEKEGSGYNKVDSFFLEKGESYMALFKYNKAIMLVIDPDTFDIIDANIAACNFYGWSLEELMCMRVDDINTLSSEEVRAEMQHALDERRNYFVFKHKLANGDIRDVEVYSSPVTVMSRDLLYSIIHDITDRKHAEDELKTREMQLRTAQMIGHIGSWDIDMASGKVNASDEAKRIYGLEDGQFTLDGVQEIPLPEYRPMMNEALGSLIREGTPYNIQFKIKRLSDGAIRDIHSIAEYYAGKNMVIGTIEDITERKEAEDALLHAKIVAEAASKSKDEFLATMSHELRTPLTSVIGFSDVLLDKAFGELDEKQARYVTHICDAGKHLLKLINDILDISKVEAGRMELHNEHFSIPVAIDEVEMLLSPLAKKKHIKMGVDVDQQVDTINADRTKFKQILYNLGSNAIKFTSDRGSVNILARRSDNVIIISVNDNGIGISDEDVGKLFHPFTQLNSYLTHDNKGTGLGLALVKKFVELHDGRIWVQSKVGEGSTFSFSIPVGDISENGTLE